MIKYNSDNLTKEFLIQAYKTILYPRMIEEKMLFLLRQNRISKWFSGIGQEAISAGIVLALNQYEYILPMHRNLPIFTGRNIGLKKLFSQWQGKMEGFTKGRDRSFHFGTKEHHIVGMISHLGPQMGVACGIALAEKLNNSGRVVAVFTGDGGTSQGEFHEAINLASVWDLPVIFVIENNGYGLSTPSREQFNFSSFVDKGIGYGIEAFSVDGNNILEVYKKTQEISQKMRSDNKPVILECMTFRMRGHEESSGTKYIPKELFEKWEKLDPITNYENFLKNENIISHENIDLIKKNFKSEINDDVDYVMDLKDIEPNSAQEFNDIFAPFEFKKVEPNEEKTNIRFVEAISQGLKESLKKFDNLIIMGQDIAEYGGVFKVTEGFLEEYGKDRIRNTTLCESAVLGAGLGLSIAGKKSVIEMQFSDFVSTGFTQVVNNLAKLHYRWGEKADVVVRMPTGAGVGAGPFHSQSTEAWFFKVPGLKIFYPAFPYDAKGLLISAIEDPNPVMFFEHKFLYRKINQDVPNSYYNIEPGKANLLRNGSKATIITYGLGVHWALDLLKTNEYDVDLIDLRTLVPLDLETISVSIKKTGKALILHEDTLTLGIGAEIAAIITKELFEFLDAPIYRVGSLDTPVPFATNLENNFLAKNRLKENLEELMRY